MEQWHKHTTLLLSLSKTENGLSELYKPQLVELMFLNFSAVLSVTSHMKTFSGQTGLLILWYIICRLTITIYNFVLKLLLRKKLLCRFLKPLLLNT